MSLIQENLLDHVLSVLLHPAPAAQLLAAWCLRCITVAVPSQATPLIDRCINRISSLKSSGEAVGGYAHTLAALVGGVHKCPLGIPHAKGKVQSHFLIEKNSQLREEINPVLCWFCFATLYSDIKNSCRTRNKSDAKP